MAGYTLYPEELDGQSLTQNRNKSLFPSSLNFLKLDPPLGSRGNAPNTGRVEKVFYFLRIILTCLGRWPFQPQKDYYYETRTMANGTLTNHIHPHLPPFEPNLAWVEQGVVRIGHRTGDHSDLKIPPVGQVHYSSSIKSIFWLYFIFTTLFLSIVLLFSILGFCDFFLDWNLFAASAWDDEEQRNFESSLVPFVLVWSCLMHSSISSISFLINRKKVVKYLNFWNEAVDEMDIDVPKGIRRFILMNNVAFIGFLAIIFIAYRILSVDKIELI